MNYYQEKKDTKNIRELLLIILIKYEKNKNKTMILWCSKKIHNKTSGPLFSIKCIIFYDFFLFVSEKNAVSGKERSLYGFNACQNL